jgi:mitogen-activated protein kinase 7
VSIHESAEGLPGGLAEIAPIGKYIMDRRETEADAPPSEMPRDFGIEEASEGEEDGDGYIREVGEKERKEGKFQI